jgi:hypothetical protein
MGSNKSDEEKTIGRRELLKALAATGGAVTAASMLPGKWVKPVIEAGVLPAHAQSSAFNISGLNVQFVDIQPVAVSPDYPIIDPPGNEQNPLRAHYFAWFSYNDPEGKVDGDAEVMTRVTFQPSGISAEYGDYAGEWGAVTGDGYHGQIADLHFILIWPDGDTSATFEFYIKTSDGRTSNVITKSVTRPPSP